MSDTYQIKVKCDNCRRTFNLDIPIGHVWESAKRYKGAVFGPPSMFDINEVNEREETSAHCSTCQSGNLYIRDWEDEPTAKAPAVVVPENGTDPDIVHDS